MFRCCPVAPVAMASAGAHVANGTVSSCHCHSVNCTAEFHVLHPSAEIDALDNGHLQLANVGLVENRHCDTKVCSAHRFIVTERLCPDILSFSFQAWTGAAYSCHVRWACWCWSECGAAGASTLAEHILVCG